MDGCAFFPLYRVTLSTEMIIQRLWLWQCVWPDFGTPDAWVTQAQCKRGSKKNRSQGPEETLDFSSDGWHAMRTARYFTVVLVVNIVGFDQWWNVPWLFLREGVLHSYSPCSGIHWIVARANLVYAIEDNAWLLHKANFKRKVLVELKLQDASFTCMDISGVFLAVHGEDVSEVAVVVVAFHADSCGFWGQFVKHIN